MKTIACAAAALLLIGGSALAEDKFAPPANAFAPPPLKPEKPQSRHHDWTGFYVGAQTGLSTGDAKSKWSENGTDRSGGFGSTSPTFGAHAGYNYQFGRGVVLGGESDVSPK